MDTVLSFSIKGGDLTNVKKFNYHWTASQLVKHEDDHLHVYTTREQSLNVGSNHDQEDQRMLALCGDSCSGGGVRPPYSL